MEQLSLFDIPEFLSDETSFEEMTIEEAASIINARCQLNLKPTKFVFDDDRARIWSCKNKGLTINIYFTHFASDVFSGQRFLSIDVEKNLEGAGYIALSIDEAVEKLRRRINK